jgi:dihydrofolate synthase/folylpolyglutamate synthase
MNVEPADTTVKKEKHQPELFEPEYLVSLDEIYHSHWTARKKRRIQFLRDAVTHFWPGGHPSKLIHITGTNGKGSVAFYLEQGLHTFGNSGSWTGPHVFDYAERFHINGEIASHRDIVSIYRDILMPYQERFIRETPGESLSFAELGILTTLHLFEKYNVQWGIMEVGAGGRYTPLMALDMCACILTNVGHDHPKTLGTEIWQRALEKAGIARPQIPFFTSAEEPALTYVRKTAEAEGAPVFAVKQDEMDAVSAVVGKQPEFKLRNLVLAVKVIRHFFPEFRFEDHAPQMTASLPARFRHIAPNIIADVSHNPDKIKKLVEQLKARYPSRKFRFLIGLTRSRNVREVFAPILELAEHIVVTSASYAGQDPEELAALLRSDFKDIDVIEDPESAFDIEKKRLKKDELLVLTGSAYMIDQAINPNPYIKHLNATFGRRVTSV